MRSEEILKRTEEGMAQSSKVLIQELIHDLEEKGIFPVWAIDGEMKNFTRLVSDNDLEDFEKELKKFGLEKSDFCILAEDLKNSESFKQDLGRIVIVIHKKSAEVKKYKSYQARNNSHWVTDFHHDLKNNFFSNLD